MNNILDAQVRVAEDAVAARLKKLGLIETCCERGLSDGAEKRTEPVAADIESEYEYLQKFLDDAGVPHTDDGGAVFSILGRVLKFNESTCLALEVTLKNIRSLAAAGQCTTFDCWADIVEKALKSLTSETERLERERRSITLPRSPSGD